VKRWAETGEEPEGGRHDLYEAVLEETLGKRVWSVIRNLERKTQGME